MVPSSELGTVGLKNNPEVSTDGHVDEKSEVGEVSILPMTYRVTGVVFSDNLTGHRFRGPFVSVRMVRPVGFQVFEWKDVVSCFRSDEKPIPPKK